MPAVLGMFENLNSGSRDSQVIDCGGGTVDISAFRVVRVSPARLDQVGKAAGGPWGSTNVDKQFEGYLKVRRLMSGMGWPRSCERGTQYRGWARREQKGTGEQQSSSNLRQKKMVPLSCLVQNRHSRT